MEIQYAVMIDLRPSPFAIVWGEALSYLTNLKINGASAASQYAVRIVASGSNHCKIELRTLDGVTLLAESATVDYVNMPHLDVQLAQSGGSGISGIVDIRLIDNDEPPIYGFVGIQHAPLVGLYNSSLCWITGTPGFDGVTVPAIAPNNTQTGTQQDMWKEGIIAKNSLGQPSMMVDPTFGGSYSSMSGMEVKAVGSITGVGMPWGEFLRRNEIMMHRCAFRFYQVEDGEFTLVNSFVVEDVVEDDGYVSLQCVDEWLKIHKEMPQAIIEEKSYPKAPEDARNRPFPICIGAVPYAELIPISGMDPRIIISQVGGEDVYVTRATQWVPASKKLVLKTGDVPFTENQLRGKYLRVVRAGITTTEYEVNLIEYNEPSSTTNQTTAFYLRDLFYSKADLSIGTPAVAGKDAFTDVSRDAWWFEVYSMDDYRAAAGHPVIEFSGGGVLSGWDGDSGARVNLNTRKIQAYPYGTSVVPGATDVAGFLVRPVGDAVRKQPVDTKFVEYPKAVLISNTLTLVKDLKTNTTKPYGTITGSDVALALGELPLLLDRSQGTAYYRAISVAASSYSPSMKDKLIFQVRLPPELLLESDEVLHAALDADFILPALTGSTSKLRSLTAILSWHAIDVYGARISDRPPAVVLFTQANIPIAGYTKPIREVSSFYYGNLEGGTVTGRLLTGVAETLRDADSRNSVAGIEFTLEVTATMTSHGYEILAGFPLVTRLREVAIMRRRPTSAPDYEDAYEGKLYTKLIGTSMGESWEFARYENDPREASTPVLSIPDAIEWIMRTQDGAGAAIDTASFDFTSLKARPLPNWYIGQQVTEQKGTVEYIEELCRHGFCCMVPGRDGKRRLLPIDGYMNFDGTFGFNRSRRFDEENIVAGSFKDARIVGMDRVYTGLTLKYDYNPATETYNKIITVGMTDQDTFPSATAMNSRGVKLWTTFVGGISNYGLAKQIWGGTIPGIEGGYRKAYMISQLKNVHEIECPWFPAASHFGSKSQDAAAAQLALVLSQWFSGPRIDYTFRVAATPTNLDLYLLQRIQVKDVIRTANECYLAIITALELDPVSSEIEVTCQRLLTDRPYYEPEVVFESIEGVTIDPEVLVGPPPGVPDDPVSSLTEQANTDKIKEIFYP